MHHMRLRLAQRVSIRIRQSRMEIALVQGQTTMRQLMALMLAQG
jgi:hypothetical protein